MCLKEQPLEHCGVNQEFCHAGSTFELSLQQLVCLLGKKQEQMWDGWQEDMAVGVAATLKPPTAVSGPDVHRCTGR